MLAATAALDTSVGLQRNQLRHVLARIEAEVFVADQRRNLAEAIALQEHRNRAQHQMKMLGVRNQRHEHEEGDGVRPPQCPALLPSRHERSEVGRHQRENEKSDEQGFVGDGFQPAGPDDKAAKREARNPDGNSDAEQRRKQEIKSTHPAVAREQLDVQTFAEVIEGDQGERAEAPEYERVGDSRQRALPDYFSLQQNFPDEVPNTPADRLNGEVRILFGFENGPPDLPEPVQKAV